LFLVTDQVVCGGDERTVPNSVFSGHRVSRTKPAGRCLQASSPAAAAARAGGPGGGRGVRLARPRAAPPAGAAPAGAAVGFRPSTRGASTDLMRAGRALPMSLPFGPDVTYGA